MFKVEVKFKVSTMSSDYPVYLVVSDAIFLRTYHFGDDETRYTPHGRRAAQGSPKGYSQSGDNSLIPVARYPTFRHSKSA